jgi:hypothetical protein
MEKDTFCQMFLTKKSIGPDRDLNPGPPPPKGGIIPLDHRGCCEEHGHRLN